MRSFFVLSLLGLVAANNNTTGDATTTTAAAASNVTTTTAAATTTTAAATTTTAAHGGGGHTAKNATAKTANTDSVEAEFKGYKSNDTCADIKANSDLQAKISSEVAAASPKFGKAIISDCKESRRLAAGRKLAEKTLALTVRIYPAAGVSAADLKTEATTTISTIATKITNAFTSAGVTIDATSVTPPTQWSAKSIVNKNTGSVTFKFFTDSKCTTAATAANVVLTFGDATCTNIPFMGTTSFLKAMSYEDDMSGEVMFGGGNSASSCTGEETFQRGACSGSGSKYMTVTIGAAAASSTSGAVSTGLGAAAALTAAVLMF